MQVTKTDFDELYIIEPKLFVDERGYFFESYNQNVLYEKGIDIKFVQDNQSKSSYGVIRGLHFQRKPYAQTKLIRALVGKILDVVVDLRADKPTFGQKFAIELSSENQKQLLVPQGFAHGFSVLSETAIIQYKCDNFYHKESDGGLYYADKQLNIDWKIDPTKAVISEKDKRLPHLKELEYRF